MLRFRSQALLLPCALPLLAACFSIAVGARCAADDAITPIAAPLSLPTRDDMPELADDGIYNITSPKSAPIGNDAPSLAEDGLDPSTEGIVRFDEQAVDELPDMTYHDDWSWQWVPVSLIYHSYMAGVHEPRMSLFAFSNLDGRSLWDASLGGRVGFLRYGNEDPFHPEGYQLDFYGAAITRLDVDNQQDLDSTDYVFGFPITYGIGQWQTKFGYAHISSHLGDEFAIRVPGSLDDRVNYVRDSLVYGVSYYPLPVWRVYGEADLAFHRSGGAGSWMTQFGTELSRPGPTGNHGTPFLAVNGRLRDDKTFGGDLTVQAGWLRRNILDQTLRIGAQYYNGRTSQFQFFRDSEQQLGLGVWYDF